MDQKIILALLAGAGLALAVWYIMKEDRRNRRHHHHSGHGGKKEGYVSVGDLDHLDSIDGSGPYPNPPDYPYPGTAVDTPEDLDDAYGTPSAGDRYDALVASNMRTVRAGAQPMFGVDVTNPGNWTAQVQLRLPMKNPQYLQADPYRGDIPITRQPGVCLTDHSEKATRDALRYDAFFSPYSNLARFQTPHMKVNACDSSNGGTQCDS